MPRHFAMNSFQGKRVLAMVRDGDFAHAGEEEAIERAMREVPKDPNQCILDAGCGRGGTAAYMQRNGWGQVTGIDVEAESIAHAQEVYPDLTFVSCNINELALHLDRCFDVITLFNVLYALPDHAGGLRSLADRGKPKARLVIFDYVDRGGYQGAPFVNPGIPFLPNPPRLEGLTETLETGGWRLQEVRELHDDYERWYVALISQIKAKRDAIERLVGPDGFEHVLGRYGGLLSEIREGRLDGAVIYGEKLT